MSKTPPNWVAVFNTQREIHTSQSTIITSNLVSTCGLLCHQGHPAQCGSKQSTKQPSGDQWTSSNRQQLWARCVHILKIKTHEDTPVHAGSFNIELPFGTSGTFLLSMGYTHLETSFKWFHNRFSNVSLAAPASSQRGRIWWLSYTGILMSSIEVA